MSRSLFYSLALHVAIVCLFLVGALMHVKQPVAKPVGNIKAYVYREPALIARDHNRAVAHSSSRSRKHNGKPVVSSDQDTLMSKQ